MHVHVQFAPSTNCYSIMLQVCRSLCFPSYRSPILSITCKLVPTAGSDDFSDVRQDLSPLADLWRSLATALGLPTSSVSEVELECRGVPARCLDLVIEKWLNQDYPYSKFGLPSWRRLVLAVDSRAGGKYPKLARDIAEKHPAHKRTFTVCTRVRFTVAKV